METPFEMVMNNVESTLAAITQSDGYNNTLEVSRFKKDGSVPAPSTNKGARPVRLVAGELIPHVGQDADHVSPVNFDDYTQVIYMDCYDFESQNSEMTPDVVGYSVLSDAIKALNIDYQRGVHPTNGQPLALNTKVRFATPMEVSQSNLQGTVLRIEIHVRTRKNDPTTHWLES